MVSHSGWVRSSAPPERRALLTPYARPVRHGSGPKPGHHCSREMIHSGWVRRNSVTCRTQLTMLSCTSYPTTYTPLPGTAYATRKKGLTRPQYLTLNIMQPIMYLTPIRMQPCNSCHEVLYPMPYNLHTMVTMRPCTLRPITYTSWHAANMRQSLALYHACKHE